MSYDQFTNKPLNFYRYGFNVMSLLLSYIIQAVMENTNNTSEESVRPERGTEQAVSEDIAEGEDTPVVTIDPNGGTELGVNEDNVEGEGQSHFGL